VAVVRALLDRQAHPLGDLPRFFGAGIYAIYYRGEFSAYAPIADANTSHPRWPIYIGKAIPPGGRKGGVGADADASPALSARLREHAESIEAALNPRLADFLCRFLVVHDLWIPLAERLLIARCAPVWNTLVDGFGNHDPGSGRCNGVRSRWDVLHPGRAWADKCRPRPETVDVITREVEQYLMTTPLPDSAFLAGE
jgi:hypothetical protein